MRLVVLKNADFESGRLSGVEVISFEELRSWVSNGRVLGKVLRYRSAELRTYALPALGRWLPTALLMRALTCGPVEFTDEAGARERIDAARIVRLGFQWARDALRSGSLVRRVGRAVDALGARSACVLPDSGAPLYLRTDFAFGLRGGGSVGHIAGVLNKLDAFGEKPVFISSDFIPTIRSDIETHVVWPQPEFRDIGELWSAAYNEHFLARAREIVGPRRVRFVYQRYSHNNYCGLALSSALGVPFVLEYNGSEVWMARHWGRPLKHERLAEKIELANLRGADLVVVVSKAMRDELVARGIDPTKILVNPNGVDPDVYRPDLDGSEVRCRYGLEGLTVVGFIGTFGRWHGAEVLVDAYGRLLERREDLRGRTRLLMVGDGITASEARAAAQHHGIADNVIFTGTVPQELGPVHLAAMDVLVSPHVPNPDGTPFFGSPTKLFEYMAMGRGIVASDLDQIGEVLEHDRTAWLVKPGDAEDLSRGIERLVDDPELRARLGAAAREQAVAKHTWREHTRRIVEALRERCGRGSADA
ncbi:glycosyltransferase [Coriobacteriia bacterium Es71-Z0120]|uniref:glycosyltransferase n=1 Tax=Parvivirga hydrogeniphila TaxID=2939460 RepID=UPI002260C2CA|nr:glycosyltransferase [Parvivirga hydrogeniphila]MCL4079345.1 glycosyltransferase [Parvivirga hydrogeniphila]